jgi:hypothetical protein
VFCIRGRKLRSAICPPGTFLFRRNGAEYFQDGHTQKLKLDGRAQPLSSPIFHDDRKSLTRWLDSQKRYARLEAQKLLVSQASSLDFADRIRRLRVLAPLGMWLYCLFVRGAILDGRAGIFYSCQRLTAEVMLSLFLLEHDLRLDRRKVRAGALLQKSFLLGRRDRKRHL